MKLATDGSVVFENDGDDDQALAFMQAIRPGDQLRWGDRKRPLEVVFVDPDADYAPRSLSDWTNKQTVLLSGQRGAYFRLNLLNNGNIRVYRLTNSNWDYGTSSEGCPDEFYVVDRLNQPGPELVRARITEGQQIVDALNPWRWSVVTDPSDAVGDVVVEPWQPGEHVPYPHIDDVAYAVRSSEVIGWRKEGTAPGISF